VDRLACVDVPALPLQLLLQRRPELAGLPVVVVDEDKPLGVVLWANEAARQSGVLPGMRYAAALSLARELRAGVIDDETLVAGVASLHERLCQFSPDVEPAKDEPGVFWLNASGLDPLYPSLLAWTEGVRAALRGAGFFSTVVVGFSRFGTWAVAKGRPGYGVLQTQQSERRMAAAVPLDRLRLVPKVRDDLARLGVLDVGGLVRLPAAGLLRRFGKEVHRVHELARGVLSVPLTPHRPLPPPRAELLFDFAVADTERLLFLIKPRLDELLLTLSSRGAALAGLKLRLRTERDAAGERQEVDESIRPAKPTLEARLLMNLLHLRLSALELGTGVVELSLEVESVAATLEQVRLFEEALPPGQRRRDLAAGDRALARVRARYGDEAVVRARLTEGHLPEASFVYEAMTRLALPRPSARQGPRRLVRRVLERAEALPPRPRHEPDGWMLRGLEHGRVVRVFGPYGVSGGWWRSATALVQREYHFAETSTGALLWVYYDRRRRRWFLQGLVE
jgi:protein ImuB